MAGDFEMSRIFCMTQEGPKYMVSVLMKEQEEICLLVPKSCLPGKSHAL